MALILIQKDDNKSRNWANAAEQVGLGQIYPNKGSPIWMIISYWKLVFSGHKPDAVVFRYLNDYPSLIKTLARFISEAMTVGSALLLGTRIGWICHNVDKESSEHHPRLTEWRRGMLFKVSKKIFVTDESFLLHFSRLYGVSKERLGITSFGEVCRDVPNKSVPSFQVVRFAVHRYKSNTCRASTSYIGLWIGTGGEKKFSGLRTLPQIVCIANQSGIDIAFVVIGNIGKWLKTRDKELYDWMVSNPKCLFFDEHINLSLDDWSLFDFIWKPYDDISMPLTVYHAAQANLPIIVANGSPLEKVITKNRIGVCVNRDLSDFPRVLLSLEEFKKENSSSFFSTRSWHRAASEMFKLCD